ncbi:MAG TPA: DNA polymerase I [Steroidobacteraceae bacterium]|nr:DNA polymerase I [Steroidobacteraceae bacterium]
MNARRKLVLVDASGYFYRAFHALPPLQTARGEQTGAVFGVVNMLNKLCREESPELIAVVFDAPGRTFRDELFEQYKATRTPMPDDLRSQLQPLLDCVEAMGLPVLRIAGVEADDVIGTLAKQAAAQDFDVLISTGDKDIAQVVSDRITLVNTMFDSRLDREGVKNKFGVWPEQVMDYLALIGDDIDNIPGIDKVGPKTAAKWLNEYGTLDKLVENAAAIGGKVGENLRAGLQTLELSRKLATIDSNLTLDCNLESLVRREPNKERLRELYTRLEFRALLRALEGGAAASGGPMAAPPVVESAAAGTRPPANYESILTMADLQRWIERLQAAELVALHIETASFDYMEAEIIGLAFCVEPGTAAYVPLAHDYAGAPQQLAANDVLQALKPLLENEQLAKIGHHIKYGEHALKRKGIELRGMRYDSMLESYVWNSTATRHEEEAVVRRYLGFDPIHLEDLTGRGAKQIPFSQVSVDNATKYAAESADLVMQLHGVLWTNISGLPALQSLYEQIEQPLVPVLYRMEQAGVLIDGELLRQQSLELARQIREIEGQAHAAAGGPFSLESPKQLQEVLFGKLQLPVLAKTATGQPSTAEGVLEELAEKGHELPQLILNYRGFAKLKSTYTDKLPLQINRTTQRVHTCYHQAVAATGRLSSMEPNLQNIPIRTPEGRRIRQAFVAPPGWCIVAADYSQIELRIMAHLSGDEGLLNAFAEERDIHQATAAEVFGRALDQVSDDQRRTAKMINFGLIYGMSAFGLAARLGIERSEAKRYVDLYFERYPGVRRYMDETRQQARERGYVETVFGRRLYLNDIASRNAALRQGAERAAINAPMQGTAADIIKRAMIAVDQWLSTSRIPARLIMQVHDELVFEVQRGAAEELMGRARELMSSAAALRTSLKVDVGSGSNWDEAH